MKYFSVIFLCFVVFRPSHATDADVAKRNLRELQTTVPTFIVNAGLVIIEAESIPLKDPWFFGKDGGVFDGFTGKGYIRTGAVTNSTPGYGAIQVKIRVGSPGKYRLLLRSNKVGQNITSKNSCYTRILGLAGAQGEPILTYQNEPRYAWTFATKHLLGKWKDHAIFNFPRPDVYTLEISAFAPSFYIDRIVLYDPLFVPIANAKLLSLSESPRVSVPIPVPAPVTAPTSAPVKPPKNKPTLTPIAPVPLPTAFPSASPTSEILPIDVCPCALWNVLCRIRLCLF